MPVKGIGLFKRADICVMSRTLQELASAAIPPDQRELVPDCTKFSVDRLVERRAARTIRRYAEQRKRYTQKMCRLPFEHITKAQIIRCILGRYIFGIPATEDMQVRGPIIIGDFSLTPKEVTKVYNALSKKHLFEQLHKFRRFED